MAICWSGQPLWLFALKFSNRSGKFVFFYAYTPSCFNQVLDTCDVIAYLSSLNSVTALLFLFSWTRSKPKVIHLINDDEFDASCNYPYLIHTSIVSRQINALGNKRDFLRNTSKISWWVIWFASLWRFAFETTCQKSFQQFHISLASQHSHWIFLLQKEATSYTFDSPTLSRMYNQPIPSCPYCLVLVNTTITG